MHAFLKFALATLLPLFFLHQGAWASCLKPNNDKSIKINLPNTVYVFQNAAIGTVVWSNTAGSNSPAVRITCAGQTYGVHKYADGLVAVAGMTAVYQTSVPYLGIKVVETMSYTVVGTAVTRWFSPPVNFDGQWARPSYQVSLVVTGPVTGDQNFNMPKPLARDYASDSPASLQNEYVLHELEVSSTNIRVNKAGSPCTTANVSANLGTQQASAFTGIGSFTSAASFNIQLANCPIGMSAITYQIDPTTAVVANTGQSVVTLNAGSTATGVGVQLLDGSGTPFPLGSPTSLGNAGGSYTIPLKARFYQTGGTVGGGTANAAMTFTITYQ
ncbi:fimbrial protein [Ramlibacter monticola]